VKRGWPTTESVTTENKNFHEYSFDTQSALYLSKKAYQLNEFFEFY